MSRRQPLRRALATLATVGALAALACAGDPARQVETRRARYSVTMQSFVVRDEPGAARQQVVLDVLVGWQGGDPLPGLTVDVSMADPTGKEKAHRRLWLDVSKVDRGGAQSTLLLDDVPYQAGDGFYVEVRSPVPAAERADYREFAAGS